jgi:hypothetical protein
MRISNWSLGICNSPRWAAKDKQFGDISREKGFVEAEGFLCSVFCGTRWSQWVCYRNDSYEKLAARAGSFSNSRRELGQGSSESLCGTDTN